MRHIVVGGAFAALLGLSACATQPSIPYDRSAARENKTIALLTPGWPSGPSSILASNLGQSFGLVGALVNGAMQSNREADLTKILAGQNLDEGALFVSKLTADLRSEGYTVLPVPADPKRTDFLKDYPSPPNPGVDSFLDIDVSSYGYLAAGVIGDTPYRPTFSARVKLVRASDKSVLMQDFIYYNPALATKNAITISPDPAYAFEKWDNVTADPQKSALGVSAAVKQSADTSAGLLR